jgi:uncharacterized membrane protein (UPF0136 family)
MRYSVPQFIDVKEKIVFGLTFTEGIYILCGGGAGYLAYKYIPSIFGIIVGIACIVAGFAMAKTQMNGRTLPQMCEAMFYYFVGARMYSWQQRKVIKKPEVIAPKAPPAPPKKETRSKDLSWGLDILDKSN